MIKRAFFVRKIFVLFICLIFLFDFSGCSDGNISLYDYNSIEVPAEVKSVSPEDISLSIQMRLREKEVFVEKTFNKDLVEENDVVEICFLNEEDENITIVVGDEYLYHGFDDFIIGKRKDNEYIFEKEDIKFSFKIVKIMCFAESITDDIAKNYFDFESKELFETYVKNEIVRHRVFEYKYEIFLNKSSLNEPSEKINEYVEQKIAVAKDNAVNEGITLSEYLESEYNISLSEFRDEIEFFYKEYNVLEEVMRREKIDISENAIHDYVVKTAEKLGVDATEIFEYNTEEDIRYQMYYEKIFDIISKE